jgi:2-oxoglutarate dehydrogenase E2 component (dihydrolipoamide succinyltransferase)
MSFEIKIPSVGESISSGVLNWVVSDGATVNAGQVLFNLETDKITSEVNAEQSGVVNIAVASGSEVAIGATVGSIAPAPTAVAAPPAPAKSPAPEAPKLAPAAPAAPAPEPVRATAAPAPMPSPVVTAPRTDGRETRKKMTPLRRKIATHLVNAQHTAAILTTFNEVDMTGIMELRKTVQDSFVARYGVKLGFMSFFVKAVVEALKSVPQVNGRIEGDEIIQNHFYDVGVAVGTEKGLIVPVLRDCDDKSFAQIEKDIIDYATKAKEGRIQLEDLQGGVFTISNGGVYGSLLSTPILNPPQSAILGMHTIKERPVAVNGKVEIRPMMYLALSYDHRLVDGKEAVTFLIRIKDSLEQPTKLLLGI